MDRAIDAVHEAGSSMPSARTTKIDNQVAQLRAILGITVPYRSALTAGKGLSRFVLIMEVRALSILLVRWLRRRPML
jgi:hypothetical protein